MRWINYKQSKKIYHLQHGPAKAAYAPEQREAARGRVVRGSNAREHTAEQLGVALGEQGLAVARVSQAVAELGFEYLYESENHNVKMKWVYR